MAEQSLENEVVEFIDSIPLAKLNQENLILQCGSPNKELLLNFKQNTTYKIRRQFNTLYWSWFDECINVVTYEGCLFEENLVDIKPIGIASYFPNHAPEYFEKLKNAGFIK